MGGSGQVYYLDSRSDGNLKGQVGNFEVVEGGEESGGRAGDGSGSQDGEGDGECTDGEVDSNDGGAGQVGGGGHS